MPRPTAAAQGASKRPIAVLLAVLAIVAVGVVALVFFTQRTAPEQTSTEFNTFGDAPQTRQAGIPGAGAGANVAAEGVVMTLGGSADTYVLRGEQYLEAGCHALDQNATGENDITSTVTIEGSVDTSKVGEYPVTYTAHTADGRTAKAQRTVHVVDSFEGGSAASIPVFMYHYLYDRANPPAKLDANYLPIDSLEGHLKYLTENGYYFPSFQEIRGFAEGTHSLPAKCATLTFDDGEWNVYTRGGELFKQYETPATMYLICENNDIPALICSQANPYITFQSHTYKMHNGGSGIGRGGIIHAMSQQEIADDIRTAQEILGTTESVAYPFGDNNETAWAALNDADVLCAFTVENRRIKPGDNPMALPRVRINGEIVQSAFESLAAPDAK